MRSRWSGLSTWSRPRRSRRRTWSHLKRWSRPRAVWWLPRGTLFLWGAALGTVLLGVLVTASWKVGANRWVASALQDRVIVIDPGHGGPDPGAVGPRGELEKDVVLAISRYLAEYMRAAGAHPVLTRDKDEDLSGLPPDVPDTKAIDLKRRVEIARQVRGEVFLCIHANATPSPVWHGAQTFYRPTPHADSARLARCIQTQLIEITRRTDRTALPGEKQYVLDNALMPAVTVEVGFMSNPTEAALLSDPDYQRLVAWAIFLGTARFFAEGQRS